MDKKIGKGSTSLITLTMELQKVLLTTVYEVPIANRLLVNPGRLLRRIMRSKKQGNSVLKPNILQD